MTKVLVTLKVMPKEANVDLDELESKIKLLVNPDRMTREPIAFGLFALNVSKLVEDAEGQVEAMEEKLRSIDLVGEIEVTEVTRTI